MTKKNFELVCPAGTLPALKTAVDAGAGAIYVGFRNETNARNFPGLNFDIEELKIGIDYAHNKKSKVFIAINTFAKAGNYQIWLDAIDTANKLNVDAVILADIGLLDYCHTNYPNLRKHLSVQAAASNPQSINFLTEKFNIKRVVLPRVLTIPEIARLIKQVNIEIEVFAFGSLCVMAEGKCSLSSYTTGSSPNVHGVCSPANKVNYINTDKGLITKLGAFTINCVKDNELAGYPTVCKGKYLIKKETPFSFENPVTLNMINHLQELQKAGVTALKIEGRQRSKAYIKEVVQTFKQAIKKTSTSSKYHNSLTNVAEGQNLTAGAYKDEWQ